MSASLQEGDNSQQPQINSSQQFQVVQPEAPLCRVNADRQDPQSVCCFWIINFCLMLLIFFLIFALPPVTDRRTNDQAFESDNFTCFNPIGFYYRTTIQCENFSSSNPTVGLVMSHVTDLNIFALLYFSMKIEKVDLEGFKLDQNITVEVDRLIAHYDKQADQRFQLQKKNIYSQDIPIKITEQDIEYYLDWMDWEYGDDYEEEDENYIRYTPVLGIDRSFQNQIWGQGDYLVRAKFQKPNQADSVISQIQLKSMVVNEDNTIYILVMRYIYLGLSIIAALVFHLRFRRLPEQDKTIEQRLVAVMAILLVFFNDPFFAITILAPNGFTTFLSILFVTVFITCLLGLVTAFLVRIFKDEGRRQFALEKWKKILLTIYFVVLFLLLITVYCIFAYQSKDTPVLFVEDILTEGFFVVVLILFILLGISIVFIALLYIGILCQCRQRTFMWRNILFLSYSIFYIIIIFITLFSLSLVPHNYLYGSEGLIFISYSYSNLYVFVLQYMYYTREDDLMEALRREEVVQVEEGNTIVSDINPLDLSNHHQKDFME